MQKFPSLNGLRAISIMMVLIYHLNIRNNIFYPFRNIYLIKPLLSILQDGQLGVNIFFVISGFLITSILLFEENKTKTISIKNFYIKRVLRIFPAYYFMLFVYFVIQLMGLKTLSNQSWILSLTYTKYINPDLDWLTAHAWSLSIEEQFYLLWPFIFLAKNLTRKTIVFLLIIIVPIIRYYCFHHTNTWYSEYNIMARIDAIATGCFFAFYQRQILSFLSLHWHKYFIAAFTFLFISPYLPALFVTFHLPNIFIALGKTYGTIANFSIGIILMYSVFVQKGKWYTFLNLKFMNYIGVLSYSIYLWQQFFISDGIHWFTHFPINILFIFIAALGSYNFIEKPFLKLKNKL